MQARFCFYPQIALALLLTMPWEAFAQADALTPSTNNTATNQPPRRTFRRRNDTNQGPAFPTLPDQVPAQRQSLRTNTGVQPPGTFQMPRPVAGSATNAFFAATNSATVVPTVPGVIVSPPDNAGLPANVAGAVAQ